MSKKRKKGRKKTKRETDDEAFISDGVRHGIVAIALFVIAGLLILAAFDLSGIAGEKVFEALTFLFGVGYFLFPIGLVLLGISLLSPGETSMTITKSIGGALFFLSGLGIIEVATADNGGFIGKFLSSPLLSFFDTWASLLLLWALFIVALILLFGDKIDRQSFETFLRIFGKRDPDEEDDYEEEVGYEDVPEEEAEMEKPEPPADEDEALMTPLADGEDEIGFFGKKTPFSFKSKPHGAYAPPPLSLLEERGGKPKTGDIKANANIIKRTLANFGIVVEMDDVSIGPSVTRYALKPAEGVKLSKILGLQNNLELALAAHPVRIEAPIPGKSLVGIEVPNTAKTTVGIASILGSKEFTASTAALTVGLGRGISGNTAVGNISKMPHLLIAGATGSGKTCAKDTYIFSEKGMLTFEELCPLPLNSEVDYSLKIATRDGIEATSKNYNNGICDFRKISTAEGLSIEVTDEHPLWVIEDGKMCWKPGESIEPGDYVAVSRASKLFGKKESINFSPAPNITNKSRAIKIPTKITPDLGLFMGLLSADGGLTIKNRIVYTQANEELLETYSSLLNNLFGISAVRIEKSGKSNLAKDIVIHSKQLKDFLTYMDMQPVRAQKKQIPRSVRESSQEIIKAFIQGLVRNDGHVSQVGLEITLANRTLLHQLQLLLLNFGIVSSLREKKVRGYEHNQYWRLALYGSEFCKYASEIGFLTEEEKKKAEVIIGRKRNPNKDIVPTLTPLLKKLALEYRTSFAKITNNGWQYKEDVLVPKYAFNSLRSYNNGDRSPSYEALEKILYFYSPIEDMPEYEEISKIQQSNFYWAKVEKVEKTSGEGYDFEVPGSNSFVGNGFVNHNSVSIHTIITSLLYRNSPDALKFIMVDPKRVELTLYNGIPHLLTPVITDAKKAILALKWAAGEMESRYDTLEQSKVRDIASYHENVFGKKKGADGEDLPPMPYIIIIIDELADIMSAYPRELEAGIVRLAQMSRAVGIHLILSTQRPSVNVITGLIKANIPSRVALQVASQVDSRTILDSSGAEKLLGAGDMLFASGEMSKPIRLQSAFISEDEVKKIVGYLKDAYEDELSDDITFSEEGRQERSDIFDSVGSIDEEDELFEEARQTVIEAGKASTSYLQRKLRIGYSRAARLMDILEEHGIVGAADGSKPREVLTPRESVTDNIELGGDEPEDEENDDEEKEFDEV